VVRIHYAIPDQLHRRAKAAAALKGISLKEYVVDALELATQVAEHRPSMSLATTRMRWSL
jgi:hypothetical protein